MLKPAILIFGVLTHADKVDDKEETRESGKRTKKEFISCLGFVGSRHRYLRCRKYCDDVDHGERMDRCLSELDVPVLRFLKAVFDPELKIQHDNESYNSKKTKPKPGRERSIRLEM